MTEDQKIRLLIVDDDPSIVKLLGSFAGGLSFETVEATHPHEALRLASQHQVHIAVVDSHMPEMAGVELMKSLRNLHSDIEVILISGEYCLESAMESIRGGAYDCLSKPIDFRHLGEELHAIRRRVLRKLQA